MRPYAPNSLHGEKIPHANFFGMQFQIDPNRTKRLTTLQTTHGKREKRKEVHRMKNVLQSGKMETQSKQKNANIYLSHKVNSFSPYSYFIPVIYGKSLQFEAHAYHSNSLNKSARRM